MGNACSKGSWRKPDPRLAWTPQFTRYDGVGELENTYRICDTTGILAVMSKGLRDKDIVEVIRGHVSTGYEFQEDKDISEIDPRYVQVPADQDKSHCLVIILDSTKVHELHAVFKEKVKVAIRAARDEDIRTAIVLTKLDKICVTVMKDTSRVFTCNHAKDIVTRTSELFGLPESKIFPMINYSTQVSKHEASQIDIIALLTLQKLLRLSYDYLEGNELS